MSSFPIIPEGTSVCLLFRKTEVSVHSSSLFSIQAVVRTKAGSRLHMCIQHFLRPMRSVSMCRTWGQIKLLFTIFSPGTRIIHWSHRRSLLPKVHRVVVRDTLRSL